MPVQVLLEEEQGGEPADQRGVDGELVARPLDRIGQQVEEGTSEQRPGGQRDERHEQAPERPLGHRRRHAADEGERAHRQPEENDPRERQHGAYEVLYRARGVSTSGGVSTTRWETGCL